MRLGRVHRRLDDAGCHRVYAVAPVRVLDRQYWAAPGVFHARWGSLLEMVIRIIGSN